MNDFNGKGFPLEDKRLSLSGTTLAGEQQYRIWHDSQQILVPRGQSITKKEANENVQVNTGVFSGIKKGYFKAPIIEFRNTEDYKLFDRFILSTYRDYYPDDENTTFDDLSTYNVDITFTLIIEWNNIIWNIDQQIYFRKYDLNGFLSNVQKIATYDYYNQQSSDDEYNIELTCFYCIDINTNIKIGQFGLGKHELFLKLQNCRINRGSSEYLYNDLFNPNIPKIKFSTNNEIKIIRGYQ